jgi:hypothetical protein
VRRAIHRCSVISRNCFVLVNKREKLPLCATCNPPLSCFRPQLLRDAEQAREIAAHGDAVDLHALAELLATRHGHKVWLRSGRPDRCCEQPTAVLRHTFLVVQPAPKRT